MTNEDAIKVGDRVKINHLAPPRIAGKTGVVTYVSAMFADEVNVRLDGETSEWRDVRATADECERI